MGILGGVANVLALLRAVPNLITWVSVVGLGFALTSIYFGVRLKQLLVASPSLITGVLIAAGAFLVIMFFVDAGLGVSGTTPLQPIVGLLFTWYLWRNVKRLAAEMHQTLNSWLPVDVGGCVNPKLDKARSDGSPAPSSVRAPVARRRGHARQGATLGATPHMPRRGICGRAHLPHRPLSLARGPSTALYSGTQ